MTGRNEPCPCGSGKKHKHCCLNKDRITKNKDTDLDKNQQSFEDDLKEESKIAYPLNILDPNDEDSLPDLPDDDPISERADTFWENFMDAPYQKQWSLVTEMLAKEPEICDKEMVFEITNTLFDQAFDADEIPRYKQLLDQLAETVPEAYADELSYILDHRIRIAIMEHDDDNLAKYFYDFSSLAGQDLDGYYRVISLLDYYGKLSILHKGMWQALPYIEKSNELVTWAYSEFTEKLGDIEILRLITQNPDLQADDATLQQRFKECELTFNEETFPIGLDYRTGRKSPSWTIDDFQFIPKMEEDPANIKFWYLLSAFTHYAHIETNIPRTKVEMARNQLAHYTGLRFEGELGSPQRRKKKRSRKIKFGKKVPQSDLYPDAKTLDQFLGQLLGFMSFRFYEAFALFELIPIWLRFLTKYNLLEEATRIQIINEISYMKGQLIQVAESQLSDPYVLNNLAGWPYEPQENE